MERTGFLSVVANRAPIPRFATLGITLIALIFSDDSSMAYKI
jgi:hypothetical protein